MDQPPHSDRRRSPSDSERPEGDGPQFPPFTPWRACLWMFTGLLTVVVFNSVYGWIDENLVYDSVAQVVVGACAFFVISAMLITQYPAGPKLGHAIGVRRTHPLAILVGLLLGVSVKLPTEKLNELLLRWLPYSKEEMASLEGVLASDSTSGAVMLLIAIGFLAPFAEELFFRGAVFGALRRYQSSSFVAGTVTALGFAAVHLRPQMVIAILPFACLLGALRASSGSLLPGVAAHIGFNTMAVLETSFRILPPFERLSPSLVQGASLACLILLAVLLTLVRLHPAAIESRERESTIEPDEEPDASES